MSAMAVMSHELIDIYLNAPRPVVNPIASICCIGAPDREATAELKRWNDACDAFDPRPKKPLRAVICELNRPEHRPATSGGRSAQFRVAIGYRERTGWQPKELQ